MCGIAGMFAADGRPLEPGVLERMTQALAHRGPEGHGVERIDAGAGVAIGLGHTRLKVVDLSDAAGQPMSNEDGSVWVVFNGEIYNFRALREQLQRQGRRFRTSSDTEVLLRCYEARGAACLEELDGMFAFAIWDGRRRELLLARDRVGKKPLFYHRSGGRLLFASEIKALLQHPAVPPEVAEEALPDFFLYGYVPTPRTLYRGIEKLPPGHLLRADARGAIRIERYWDVPLPSPRAVSEADAAVRVRELVTAAVRRRLIADVPLGAFLSGGIDSSVIVGIMSGLRQEPVKTFSIGFAGDAAFNETSYARLAAQRYNTAHTEFIVEPKAVELVERLVWHHDEPFADSSSIPTYLLSQLTRRHVTVALNGDGGDELFAGYLRFPATLWSERVPLWARRAAAASLRGVPAWGNHRNALRRLQKFAGSAALPFIERFTRWNAVFYEDLPRLLGPAFAPEEMPQPLDALQPHLAASGKRSALTQLLYLNLKTYLLDDLLVKMDRCSMAHALEARSPFLDRELMEYAFSLPDALKLRGGRTKVILRTAFSDLLPPAILRRGKMGFGVPLRTWFMRDLRSLLEDALLAPDARLRRYVDQGYVRRLWQEHGSGHSDHADRLWTLLTFELWLRNLSLRAAPAAAIQAMAPAAL